MKAFLAIAFVTLCVLALCNDAYAVPSSTEAAKPKDGVTPKDTLQKVKDAKKSKKECAKDCGTTYEPFCAHDPANPSFKPRTFGSQCALDVHNCEMGTKLVMKNKGDCAGAGGVRLS